METVLWNGVKLIEKNGRLYFKKGFQKRPKKKNAMEQTLGILTLEMPYSVSKIVSTAYPKEKILKNRKARIRLYLKTLNPIISKKRGITWTRQGWEIHRKLVRDFIECKRRDSTIAIKNMFILEPEKDYFKNLNKEARYFYHEIMVDINRLDKAFLTNHIRANMLMDRIVTKISKANGAQVGVINHEFLDTWENVSKNWKRNLRKTNKSKFVKYYAYEYFVDREKVFRLYVKINKFPKATISQINTLEFKRHLAHQFGWRIQSERFTQRNVMKSIERVLTNNVNHDYIRNSGLFKDMESDSFWAPKPEYISP